MQHLVETAGSLGRTRAVAAQRAKYNKFNYRHALSFSHRPTNQDNGMVEDIKVARVCWRKACWSKQANCAFRRRCRPTSPCRPATHPSLASGGCIAQCISRQRERLTNIFCRHACKGRCWALRQHARGVQPIYELLCSNNVIPWAGLQAMWPVSMCCLPAQGQACPRKAPLGQLAAGMHCKTGHQQPDIVHICTLLSLKDGSHAAAHPGYVTRTACTRQVPMRMQQSVCQTSHHSTQLILLLARAALRTRLGTDQACTWDWLQVSLLRQPAARAQQREHGRPQGGRGDVQGREHSIVCRARRRQNPSAHA